MGKLIPDSMAAYATYELSELLRQLTPAQREAVGRIVDHHYIQNRPLSHLFEGADKICSENTYYKRGVLDEATGEWRNQGWHHQPVFAEALRLAARLVLQAERTEDRIKLRKAKVKAIDHAEKAVDAWISVMKQSEKDADRIDAAGRVIDLAFRGSDEVSNEPASAEADDWWRAAADE